MGRFSVTFGGRIFYRRILVSPAPVLEDQFRGPTRGYETTNRGERKEDLVSEERPQHPQEPAEGGEDEVEAPGAEKSSEGGGAWEAQGGKPSDHPDEPAEGAEEDVGGSGADRPG